MKAGLRATLVIGKSKQWTGVIDKSRESEREILERKREREKEEKVPIKERRSKQIARLNSFSQYPSVSSKTAFTAQQRNVHGRPGRSPPRQYCIECPPSPPADTGLDMLGLYPGARIGGSGGSVGL